MVTKTAGKRHEPWTFNRQFHLQDAESRPLLLPCG